MELDEAVNNHWTGLLEWNTGMDYWNDLCGPGAVPNQFEARACVMGMRSSLEVATR